MKVDTSNFFNSLSLTKVNTAIDPKGGVAKTIGDPIVKPYDSALWPDFAEDQLNTSFMIVHKPRATYTDDARNGGTTGTVRLKVTLLANGSVGKITSERSLRNGLTEQAINAAKRIVFIPKKVNGKSHTVVVTVDYGFSIY